MTDTFRLEPDDGTTSEQPIELPDLTDAVNILIGRFTLEKHEARTCLDYLYGLESPYTPKDTAEILTKYGITF